MSHPRETWKLASASRSCTSTRCSDAHQRASGAILFVGHHPDKWLSGKAKDVQRLMEETWAHAGAVRDERIVEDICRFPAGLDAIIAAKGAKVQHLDHRTGRRLSKPYQPPRIEAVEELLKARFERFDPVATDPLPPKKRSRVHQGGGVV